MRKIVDEWENGDLGAQKAIENIPTGSLWITRTRDLKGSTEQVPRFKQVIKVLKRYPLLQRGVDQCVLTVYTSE